MCDWQTARVYVVLAQSTEAFPLEGKVANAMSRMRCSRRSGVIFLAMITAIAWPTPHHRLRRSLSSRRSHLVSRLSIIANRCTEVSHPTTPPWHADAIGAGWRSQTKGESRKRTEEILLSSGRFRLSPATGWPGPLPVFIQLTFTSHTGSLFLS